MVFFGTMVFYGVKAMTFSAAIFNKLASPFVTADVTKAGSAMNPIMPSDAVPTAAIVKTFLNFSLSIDATQCFFK